MSKKIIIVVGTRPNFIKVTQFKKAIKAHDNIDCVIVHTGQHYDKKMSGVFFDQFGLVPDYFLETPSASPNQQMANTMISLEGVCKEVEPSLIMVVGDVNSTFAAALTANKMGLPIAHLESGLRSGDHTMPEEINRILTDKITDYYFVTEQSGLDHLKKEGQPDKKVHFVGNTMIDTMVAFEENIEASSIMEEVGVSANDYVLMTMHRPATVDDEVELTKLFDLMEFITEKRKLVFPMHPRTLKNVTKFGMNDRLKAIKGLIITEPMDYFSFQKLIKYSKLILTDSGGIQEESTFRQVPCLTLRPNTERPSTVTLGSNELITFDLDLIKSKLAEIESGQYKKGQVPPLWDGQATQRIVAILSELL